MLEYTTTISDDLTTVTIVFDSSDIDETSGFITKLSDGSNTPFNSDTTSTVVFMIEFDSEYKLTFLNTNTSEYEESILLINVQSILCSNRKNRYDVTALLKVKKLDNTSRIIDCLNRVVIANHRLSNYSSATIILDIITTTCEGECQC